MAATPTSDIGLETVLREFGFQSEETEGLFESAFRFDFSEFRLVASSHHSLGGAKSFWFYAHYLDGRTLGQIDFKIQERVSSFEQGHALLSYYLRGHTIKDAPRWVSEGQKLSQHLPWIVDAPKMVGSCRIEREWFRPALDSLRRYVSISKQYELIEIRHDGRAISFEANDLFLTMPARGKRWDDCIWVKVGEVKKLPKRLNQIVTINVFDDSLLVGGNRLRLSVPQLETIENYMGFRSSDDEALIFDQHVYANIAPLFVASLSAFADEADDLAGMFKGLVSDLLLVQRLGQPDVEKMKPYVMQFIEDERQGIVDLELEPPTDMGSEEAIIHIMNAFSEAQTLIWSPPEAERGMGLVRLKMKPGEALTPINYQAALEDRIQTLVDRTEEPERTELLRTAEEAENLNLTSSVSQVGQILVECSDRLLAATQVPTEPVPHKLLAAENQPEMAIAFREETLQEFLMGLYPHLYGRG